MDYKRVACLRAKYRVLSPTGDMKQRLMPEAVGCHPLNRDGLSPNPGRVEELLKDILGHFDPEEGDHSICIEMASGPAEVFDFNKQKCHYLRKTAYFYKLFRSFVLTFCKNHSTEVIDIHNFPLNSNICILKQ